MIVKTKSGWKRHGSNCQCMLTHHLKSYWLRSLYCWHGSIAKVPTEIPRWTLWLVQFSLFSPPLSILLEPCSAPIPRGQNRDPRYQPWPRVYLPDKETCNKERAGLRPPHLHLQPSRYLFVARLATDIKSWFVGFIMQKR
jgi:hypothetical protein